MKSKDNEPVPPIYTLDMLIDAAYRTTSFPSWITPEVV